MNSNCYTVHIVNVPKCMCAPTQYWQCHLHFYHTKGKINMGILVHDFQSTDCTKKRTHCTVPVTLDIVFLLEHITITYSFFGSWHFSLCDLNVLNGTFTPQNMHVTSGWPSSESCERKYMYIVHLLQCLNKRVSEIKLTTDKPPYWSLNFSCISLYLFFGYYMMSHL